MGVRWRLENPTAHTNVRNDKEYTVNHHSTQLNSHFNSYKSIENIF
jgi:hypothetical protein